MKICSVKSVDTMEIIVTVRIGLDEIMDNGTRGVALNELNEAFNADVAVKDKLALLNIIASSRKEGVN